MRYPEMMIAPRRAPLRELGAQELRTPEAVDGFVTESVGRTAMLVVNSICGCSSGTLLPALQDAIARARPDTLGTVFAGADLEATERARELFIGYPPSSPAVALFRDRELVFMLERHQIQGRTPDAVADSLLAGLEAAE
ncbi:MAG TPA: BrxA/BrxB family bacilliredoxin [Longimicrobiales bacterium]|nr:BrxA/BrxB family bacilliredoxin [Longimicrobiales bacterium]